jgi:hypothetical protein
MLPLKNLKQKLRKAGFPAFCVHTTRGGGCNVRFRALDTRPRFPIHSTLSEKGVEAAAEHHVGHGVDDAKAVDAMGNPDRQAFPPTSPMKLRQIEV